MSDQSIKMSTMEEQILNQLDTEETSPAATATAKKRKRTAGPPRGPSRPYKKYEQADLEERVRKMQKQKDVMQSKLTLLCDRLEKHEAELKFRSEAEA